LKNILILILTVVCLTDLKGQQILVEQPFNGNTSYGKHAKAIESVTELPDQIQTSLEAYLTDMLGSSIKNVTFSHGQNVDLNSYFSEPNRKAPNYQWLVPSYDLNYILSDITLGIKSYYIQLRLDEYGQLLSTNWPRKGYSNEENFLSTKEIVQFALGQAKSRGFLTSEYFSDLKYQSSSESLNWVFKFPETLEPDNKQYDVIEINLTSLKVVEEYTIKTSTVN
jgi:hypothetical protein